ncbi:winged helix DNA-binding domain-containing protein [Conyzicola sp.]|uniref:winged helix DNA-binding domain-containing protein n=1 Tax=Conyzicola sp. TaxID=1969404 RepID=UPI0039895D74
MRHISDGERRARLATRHALTSDSRVETLEEAAGAVVALHATDAPSVYLSAWARMARVTVADIDRALYDDRVVVTQLAMRRTLFAFPRHLVPAVLGSAAARVATSEHTRMARDVERAGIAPNGSAWLEDARAGVTSALSGGPGAFFAAELRRAVPLIDVTVPTTADESWSAPQVLTLLGAEGTIVRGPSSGSFPTARPLWTLPARWLGSEVAVMDPADGYRELVHRWLRAFGPGTEDDIVWWLGATKAAVRLAIRELDAVQATLDGEQRGWILRDDVDAVAEPAPWTALLPPLDPTVMGWKGRAFYLGGRGPQLFDSRGNAGTTAWADGRVVGSWIQDAQAVVSVRLLEPVSTGAREALNDQASRLTSWLGGVRSPTGYRSPAMRAQEREWEHGSR